LKRGTVSSLLQVDDIRSVLQGWPLRPYLFDIVFLHGFHVGALSLELGSLGLLSLYHYEWYCGRSAADDD
jgi:hypothetical protein